MKRRQFIALLGGTAASWPLAARAQQLERMRRIGVLIGFAESDPQTNPRISALRSALSDLGWVEGRNYQLDTRWASGDEQRVQSLAHDLVQQGADVIVAHTTPVTAALLHETRNIPIVFATVTDPVGSGFVESLARPGKNVTGFINMDASLGGKWVQLLKEVAPLTKIAGAIYNPATAPGEGSFFLPPIEEAGLALSVRPQPLPINVHGEIDDAISALARQPSAGLVIMPDIFTTTHRSLIIASARAHRLPAVYPYRYFAVEGGLLSYGVDPIDPFARLATYVHRILLGTHPADLPVQAPTKFELLINLKTARALGIEVSAQLLARADEVIE